MDVPFAWERGSKLNVLMLSDSPISYELEVVFEHEMPAAKPDTEGSAIFLCKVVNVMGDESLLNPDESLTSRMTRIASVSSTLDYYLSWTGETIARWGEPQSQLNKG